MVRALEDHSHVHIVMELCSGGDLVSTATAAAGARRRRSDDAAAVVPAAEAALLATVRNQGAAKQHTQRCLRAAHATCSAAGFTSSWDVDDSKRRWHAHCEGVCAQTT